MKSLWLEYKTGFVGFVGALLGLGSISIDSIQKYLGFYAALIGAVLVTWELVSKIIKFFKNGRQTDQ